MRTRRPKKSIQSGEAPDGRSPDGQAMPLPDRPVTAGAGAAGAMPRVSGEVFAAAFALSPQAISITAVPSGRFIEVNEALIRMTGYSRDELLGRTPIELGLWADEEVWARGREVLVREGRLPQAEGRFRRKDGSILVGLAAAERIVVEGGTAILTVIADISEQKRAEEALRASEARFRAVQQTTPDGFMLFDSVREGGTIVDFRWVYVNPAAERIVGRNAEELLGRRLLEEMPGNREEGLFAAYVGVVETGEPWQREFAYAHEGLDHWFRTIAARADDGLAVSFEDITERKRAEEARRTTEELYRALVESVEEGVCIFEMLYGPDGRPRDYRFLEVNRTFERHTGLRDAVGRTARELVPGLEDHWVEVYSRVAETGEPHRFEEGSAAMGRWFEVEAVRVGGAGSRRVALLFSDVTERRRIAAELQAEAKRADFRAALTDALRLLADPDAIAAEAARLLGEHLAVGRAFYAEVEADGQHVVLRPEYYGSIPGGTGRFRLGDFGAALAEAFRAGRTLVVDDVAAEVGLSDAERAAYAAIEVRAHATACLVKEGRPVGLFGVLQAAPRAWAPDEVALLEEVAERTWAAVERARAEEALRAGETRLSLALSGARAGAWQWDLVTQRVIWSPEHYDLLGLPRSGPEHRYGAFTSHIHPADRARVRAEFADATTRGGPFDIEFRVTRADGAERWFSSVGRVECDAKGRPVTAIGISQDITARRRAEERIALLAEMSEILAGVLDEATALDALARLLVRDLADWCLISTLEGDGLVHRRAFAHADPEREALLRRLPATYPYDPAQPHGAASVIASGRSRFSPSLTAEALAERTSAPNRAVFQELTVTSGMIVPLRARGGTFGAISLLRADATRPFGQADLALAEQIADRAAATLDSARLYAAERDARARAERAVQRQAALAEAAHLFAEAGPALEPLLATTARYLTELIGDGCLIGLVADDGERIALAAADHRDPAAADYSRRAFVTNPLRVGQGVIGVVAQTGKPALHPMVDQAGLIAASEPGLRPVLERYGPRSLMAAPCRADGRTIGVIAVSRLTPGRPYTDDDLALLGDIADRASQAIERARLYDAERQAREQAEAAGGRLALLADAGIALAGSLDEEATLTALASLIVPGYADWCTINLVGDDGLRPPIAVHADPMRQETLDELLRRYPADPRGTGPVARVLQSGESLLLVAPPDGLIRANAPDEAYLDLLGRVGLTSTMIVPIIARQRLLGALRFARVGTSRPYDADDLRLAEELTRRAALALDNARLYRESRDAVAARDRFLSIAAHELRTPVTSMRAYAQLARRQRDRGHLAPELIDNTLTSIERGTTRLNTLIQDLLDVARLQAGQLRIERAPLDLSALVGTVIAEAQAHLPAGLSLTIEGATRPYPILGDAGRLEQVLGNLLENARKYSPDGGVIAVTLATDECGATIAVRDEGIGLGPGEERAIFTPFNRSEEALRRQIQGLGLGLAICRAIVEEHGGTLEAASGGQGQGTVFTLWLPAAPGVAGGTVGPDGAAGVGARGGDETNPGS